MEGDPTLPPETPVEPITHLRHCTPEEFSEAFGNYRDALTTLVKTQYGIRDAEDVVSQAAIDLYRRLVTSEKPQFDSAKGTLASLFYSVTLRRAYDQGRNRVTSSTEPVDPMEFDVVSQEYPLSTSPEEICMQRVTQCQYRQILAGIVGIASSRQKNLFAEFRRHILDDPTTPMAGEVRIGVHRLRKKAKAYLARLAGVTEPDAEEDYWRLLQTYIEYAE